MSLCIYNSGSSQVSLCVTPAGVNYTCMTPAGVKYDSMYDSCRSQVSQCMPPAEVKYVSMYDSCRSQVCHDG